MNPKSGTKIHNHVPGQTIQAWKKGKDYIGVGVGAVIINEKNEILLLLRKKPPEADCWSIPGGSVEMFETIEDAVIREIKEELKADAKIIKLLGVTNHIIEKEKTHWVSPVFLMKIKENQIPVNAEPESHHDMKWFPVNELPDNITLTTEKALKCLQGHK